MWSVSATCRWRTRSPNGRSKCWMEENNISCSDDCSPFPWRVRLRDGLHGEPFLEPGGIERRERSPASAARDLRRQGVDLANLDGAEERAFLTQAANDNVARGDGGFFLAAGQLLADIRDGVDALAI